MPTSFFEYTSRVLDVEQCMAFFHGLRCHTVLILCTLIGKRSLQRTHLNLHVGLKPPKSIVRPSKRKSAVRMRRRSPSDAPTLTISSSQLRLDTNVECTVNKNVWPWAAAVLQVMRLLWLLLHSHLFCGHKDKGRVWNCWESKMQLQAVVSPQWRTHFDALQFFLCWCRHRGHNHKYQHGGHNHEQVKEVQLRAAAGQGATAQFDHSPSRSPPRSKAPMSAPNVEWAKHQWLTWGSKRELRSDRRGHFDIFWLASLTWSKKCTSNMHPSIANTNPRTVANS